MNDKPCPDCVKLFAEQPRFCLECGSFLGVDAGDAEPDYNEDFCSKGCYKAYIKVLEKAYALLITTHQKEIVGYAN